MKKLLSGLAHSYVLAVVILSVSSSLFAAAVAEPKNDGAVAIIDTHAHIIPRLSWKRPFSDRRAGA